MSRAVDVVLAVEVTDESTSLISRPAPLTLAEPEEEELDTLVCRTNPFVVALADAEAPVVLTSIAVTDVTVALAEIAPLANVTSIPVAVEVALADTDAEPSRTIPPEEANAVSANEE